jgi:phage terminase small subunit
MKNKLTPKQSIFVQEYLIDLNATQAAIRAGYSAKSACSMAFSMLRKHDIQTAIQVAMNKRSERTKITADNVLNEIAKMAFSNIKNIYDDKGKLKPVMSLDDDTASAILEVTEKQIDDMTIERKYKTTDKLKALELLGKHLKMFTDKIEHVDMKNMKPVINLTLTNSGKG